MSTLDNNHSGIPTGDQRAETAAMTTTQSESGGDYQPMYLLGRCANGAERDKGTRVHAVPNGSWKALCNATYGRRSAGWQNADGRAFAPVVTCPRCLSVLKSRNAALAKAGAA